MMLDARHIQQYGWNTQHNRPLTQQEAQNVADSLRTRRHIVGDTPHRGKHLLWDSETDIYAECEGGLAFALGVACLEAETARTTARFWQVCHPNGNVLYHVMWTQDSHTVITKVY